MKSTTKWLLSPSETKLAEKLGDNAIVSPLPEEKGADILIYTKSGLAGIQRKECPNDFLSSFTDGRMARALALLSTGCKYPMLIREGRFKYYPDTRVALGTRKPSRFTKSHIFGMLNDILLVRNIMVVDTEDIDDTIMYLRSLADFLSTTKHLGLYSRPSAKGAWYVPTARDIDLWLLQSFPGIGPALADAIIEYFDGKIPITWTCTEEELAQVPKLTAKRANIMYNTLLGKPTDLALPQDKPKQDKATATRSKIDSLRSRLNGNK